MAAARGQLARLFARLEQELAGRDWMDGASFRTRRRGRVPTRHRLGRLRRRAFGRLPANCAPGSRARRARPSVARESGELAKFMQEMMAAAARSGDTSPPALQRQYRDHRLEWMMKSGGAEVVLAGLANGTIKFAIGHAA